MPGTAGLLEIERLWPASQRLDHEKHETSTQHQWISTSRLLMRAERASIDQDLAWTLERPARFVLFVFFVVEIPATHLTTSRSQDEALFRAFRGSEKQNARAGEARAFKFPLG